MEKLSPSTQVARALARRRVRKASKRSLSVQVKQLLLERRCDDDRFKQLFRLMRELESLHL